MKVHLIKKKTINDDVRRNMNIKVALNNWINLINDADWEGINDIKETFNSADMLSTDLTKSKIQ